ncbi:unnamed protein product [Medioppia subpectinata]|uniref:Uncharacterized protein n=1 Tax=Medioppia subpectinata TaxID=1979941 RepID=A0A7R9Q502_9ACAR|nr:unnamed protein product [Medioppia subpectinata]CAG2112795.1 unnamed protein product [Medioppia subpectinata]
MRLALSQLTAITCGRPSLSLVKNTLKNLPAKMCRQLV